MQINSNIRFTETEYGTVLLDERTSTYWQLNATGSIVLAALSDGGTVADAVRRLVEEFQVDEQQAARDVSELVGRLRSAGMVTA
jgi:hypothetical protein